MLLARLQTAMVAWADIVRPGTPAVWEPSGYVRGTGALISFQILGGPTMGLPARTTMSVPTAGTFVVGALTSGAGVAIEISGRRWEHTVAVGETSEDVRDALLGLIGTDSLVDGTFAAAGANTITVTGNALGALYRPRTAGAVTWAATAETAATYLLHDVDFRVRCQTFSHIKSPRGGAQGMAMSFLSHIGTSAQQALFEGYGLALLRYPYSVTPLDALSGPDWESRASFSLDITGVAISAESHEFIEDITGDVIARDPDDTLDVIA